MEHTPDPALDLVLERVVDLSPAQVFRAWTQPEALKPWFCPKPWLTTDAEIDLRPGGIFRTLMRGPGGEVMDNAGCILEVVPDRKFVWTGALKPGFRPRSSTGPDAEVPFIFTAVITMTPQGEGTLYRAVAIHPDEKAKETHDKMGFHAGWGAALDQMVSMMKGT